MSSRTSGRVGTRVVVAAVSLVTVILALPSLLVAVALQRFDHALPLHGMNAPWRWSIEDLRSWGRQLTAGLDSSAALVDLFLRLALVIGWVCVAVLIYSVVDEVVFQLRHGMPSARHRLGGLGLVGRKLAGILVAVLPLAMSVTPTLAGPGVARAAVEVVHIGVADPHVAEAPLATPAVAPVTSSVLGSDWSVVEVVRGDSIWAIAERVADGREVAAIAAQIVSANIGTVMNDGHRFSTPALIEPGWLLNVPASARAVASIPVAAPQPEFVSAADSYVVIAGDSYWQIAEDRLGESALPREVAAYTETLMHLNAPVLGYTDPRLIRPGDVLQLEVPNATSVPEVPAVTVPDTEVVLAAPIVPTIAAVLPPVVVTPPVSVPVAVPSPATTFPPPQSVPSTPNFAEIDATVSEYVDSVSAGTAINGGLAAAMLLSGGAILVLDARRRQQLRSARVGARLLPPTAQAVETETLLRTLTPADQLARIDLALRSAAADLARQHARALAIEIADDGEVRLYTDRPATVVADGWLLDVEAGTWRLPAEVSLADLADRSRRVSQPCPAIIHIGESAGGHLFVDLEAVGVLSVDAAPAIAASIVRCAAASLAVSPFADSTRIFSVGLEIETHLGSPSVESHDTLTAAVEAVEVTVGSIAMATSGDVTTFALRVAALGGEAWEPSLLFAIGAADPQELAALTTLARGGGRGVGAMIDRPFGGSGAVLRAADGDFILEPLGRRVTPVGLSVAEVSAVDNLLDASERPLLVDLDVRVEASDTAEFTERQRALVVQVLGNVAVQAATGEVVGFDRSKAQELVVWLSQHRRRPTRSSARTALWDVAVQDATFSNVVSDARRAMARMVTPPAGQEWLGRTMNDDLPLHDLVVSDTDLLADRFAASRGLDALAAIAMLRPGVELIHGMPFAGTSYLWPDAEGITSSLVLLATSAAADLAAHYLAIGDIDGVFWSTGQGLKVLAGHEELIALRMRAHAYRGDLAGVRGEWDSYERAISADTWAAAEPSPKLVDLRRELLSPSLAS
jgi:nucleoid-associated protein YgaU